MKTNLSLIQKKIDKIEERFVLEEIDKVMYTKFKAKYEREYIDIEKELGNTSVNVSNLKKVIKFAVELCSKPLLIWEKSDYHTRQSFQNLVFPNGISYNRELDQYRTTRINSFFAVISELVKGLRKNKR
ncbi:MAG TPA: resolvase, partial [Crocinitomix sp.]|nr:resolvase [Crocinitomix sp.]